MTPQSLPRPPTGTDGYWHRRVWALAFPIIISNVSTPLLGMVDTAVVGHLPSAHYLGAVAIGAVIFSSIFWLFGFLRMGTSGLSAQAYGAGDTTESAAILGRALMTAVVLGTLLVILNAPIAAAAFSFFETTPAVESAAIVYYDIRLWAAPATLVNYALLGWFLGMQRAGLGLVLQLILNVTNIILDLFFVIGLGWTVDGVALASVLAEGVAAVVGLAIAFAMIRRGRTQWTSIWQRTRDSAAFIRLAVVNRDIFLRTLCLIAATLWFTRQSARFGETTLAATAILQQLHLFMAHALDGFAHAAQALIGRTVGARRRRDFIAAMRASTIWAGVAAAIFVVVYAVAGKSIVALLTSLPEVRETAAIYLPWAIMMPLAAVWSFQLDGIFIGATWTRAMRNSMAVSLVVFLLATWAAIPVLGVHGLWLAMVLFVLARAATLGSFLPALIRSIPDGPALQHPDPYPNPNRSQA
ncbi:MATE family efflux transporter [Fodinicurvata sp. EGI_FJ10296]|uniref:MATE family efflux transporter n=1 Tax=Fodinicurvata sp. EGI_FJ10296 TaxID=3231908 RepID=UPI003451D2F5